MKQGGAISQIILPATHYKKQERIELWCWAFLLRTTTKCLGNLYRQASKTDLSHTDASCWGKIQFSISWWFYAFNTSIRIASYDYNYNSVIQISRFFSFLSYSNNNKYQPTVKFKWFMILEKTRQNLTDGALNDIYFYHYHVWLFVMFV